MKTLLLYSFAIIILFSSGCVKRYFKYTVNLNTTGTWHIDRGVGAFTTGSFLEGTLDLPADAVIIEANIESLTLKPRILGGYTATRVEAQGEILPCLGPRELLFPNQNLTLTGIEFIPDGLIQQGVAKLQGLLDNLAKNKQPLSCNSLYLVGYVDGERARLDIDYSIKANIKYGRCEEVLEVMGDVAQPCPGK